MRPTTYWRMGIAGTAALLLHELGHSLVARFMNPAPVTMPAATPLDEFVDEYVYRFHHRMFPVLNAGRLFGHIGISSIRTVPRSEWSQRRVWEVAEDCTDANCVALGSDALESLELMKAAGNTRLLVREKQELLGVVSLSELLKHLTLRKELEPVTDEPHIAPEDERAMRS